MAASRNRTPPDLLTRVGDFIAAHAGTTAPLHVGLSGGCDSVVLLHLLSRLGLGARLRAVHVHHGLSPYADAWAQFCLDFSARLGIDCQVQRVQVRRNTAQGLEAEARHARYAAFMAAGVTQLCLAHHQDDQAETVLFNLLRGSGVAGASGMQAVRTLASLQRLRPLLDVPRGALLAYAEAHGLDWVEDESNADRRYSRNFLRHAVFPVLTERFPAASAKLAQAAEHFAEAADLLDELARQDWQAAADGDALRLSVLRTLSVPRLKHLLRHRLAVLGWHAPVAARLDEFARQIMTAAPDRHPSLLLPEGVMQLSRGRLRWIGKNPPQG